MSNGWETQVLCMYREGLYLTIIMTFFQVIAIMFYIIFIVQCTNNITNDDKI